ncbi:hypothetical protein Lal_00047307 [Lupinus albus]|uniref:Uncharacterized protein n=1 Tax=Lupinus albus TaxID=3870 RepID=A0A6A4QTZ1_LUPAL|nr:hypothetical protein Lalb_Chr02g0141301 [Lupinus albus]KAF1878636.1 hypothetical protein Lal_00047307 [Lupinus albus]
MDALNFLKFWRNSTMTTTTTTVPDIVVETDTDSEEEEEDSFFDLELTLHHKTDHISQNITTLQTKTPPQNTTPLPLNEPISKRKILPIEPTSKPQSPIALLKSAPSFRLFTFKNRMTPHKTQQQVNTGSETKSIKVKLNIDDNFQCSPTLSRVNSTGSLKGKVQNHHHGSEESETKAERISKDVVHKYLKLIKPLYVRVSKRYSEKMKFTGEAASMASPMSSPVGSSVSSKKGNFPAGMRGASKHLGKSRSASTVAGIGSPANRSDDTLLQQNDGIQSAILHCKRSFNSRDSIDSSVHSVRSSFQDENEANM